MNCAPHLRKTLRELMIYTMCDPVLELSYEIDFRV